MKFYLDTANLEAIKKYQKLVDGVTSNPAIMSKEGIKQEEKLAQMCALVPTLPISAEVVYANSTEQICQDARKLATIGSNIIIKIPGNIHGMQAIRILKAEGYKLNVTALMTFRQLALAAQQGADYVSQFFCRGRDAGVDSVREINRAKEFIVQNGLKSEIIVGSLRTPADLEMAMLTRGDILTVSPELLEAGFTHPKTQGSIDEFAQRYEAALKQARI